VSIYFVDTEDAEQDFFEKSFPNREIAFVRGLDEVGDDVEVLCVFLSNEMDAAFVAAHPRLRFVCTRSNSTDHLDLAAMAAGNIAVANVGNYSETSVAEHTFALILALSRRLREVMAMAKAPARFSYEETRAFDLCGRTMGIIGMGHIGQRVASLAHAFQMKVIACDVETPEDIARTLQFDFVTFDELLAKADVISLHTTLSPRTYHILNHETFARCKPGALVINTARGALIDTAALRDALDSGQIGGAGLDVLQDERVLRDTASHIITDDIIKHLRSDSVAAEAHDAERVRELEELMLSDAVLQRKNVVFTPHVAFNSQESVARRNECTVESIRAYLAGAKVNRLL
jgi:D-lactate dehydrogenase